MENKNVINNSECTSKARSINGIVELHMKDRRSILPEEVKNENHTGDVVLTKLHSKKMEQLRKDNISTTSYHVDFQNAENSFSHRQTDTGIFTDQELKVADIPRNSPKFLGKLADFIPLSDTAIDLNSEECELTDADFSPILPDEMGLGNTELGLLEEKQVTNTQYTDTGTSPVEFDDNSTSLNTSEMATSTDQIDTKDASISPIPSEEIVFENNEEHSLKSPKTGDVKAIINNIETNFLQNKNNYVSPEIIYKKTQSEKLGSSKKNESVGNKFNLKDLHENNYTKMHMKPTHALHVTPKIAQLQKLICEPSLNSSQEDEILKDFSELSLHFLEKNQHDQERVEHYKSNKNAEHKKINEIEGQIIHQPNDREILIQNICNKFDALPTENNEPQEPVVEEFIRKVVIKSKLDESIAEEEQFDIEPYFEYQENLQKQSQKSTLESYEIQKKNSNQNKIMLPQNSAPENVPESVEKISNELRMKENIFDLNIQFQHSLESFPFSVTKEESIKNNESQKNSSSFSSVSSRNIEPNFVREIAINCSAPPLEEHVEFVTNIDFKSNIPQVKLSSESKLENILYRLSSLKFPTTEEVCAMDNKLVPTYKEESVVINDITNIKTIMAEKTRILSDISEVPQALRTIEDETQFTSDQFVNKLCLAPVKAIPDKSITLQPFLEKLEIVKGQLSSGEVEKVSFLKTAREITNEFEIVQSTDIVEEKMSLEKMKNVCDETEFAPPEAVELPLKLFRNISAEFEILPSFQYERANEASDKIKTSLPLADVEEKLPLEISTNTSDESNVLLPLNKVEKGLFLEKAMEIPNKPKISLLPGKGEDEYKVKKIPYETEIPLVLEKVQKEISLKLLKENPDELETLLSLNEDKKTENIIDECKYSLTTGILNKELLGKFDNSLIISNVEKDLLLEKTKEIPDVTGTRLLLNKTEKELIIGKSKEIPKQSEFLSLETVEKMIGESETTSPLGNVDEELPPGKAKKVSEKSQVLVELPLDIGKNIPDKFKISSLEKAKAIKELSLEKELSEVEEGFPTEKDKDVSGECKITQPIGKVEKEFYLSTFKKISPLGKIQTELSLEMGQDKTGEFEIPISLGEVNNEIPLKELNKLSDDYTVSQKSDETTETKIISDKLKFSLSLDKVDKELSKKSEIPLILDKSNELEIPLTPDKVKEILHLEKSMHMSDGSEISLSTNEKSLIFPPSTKVVKEFLFKKSKTLYDELPLLSSKVEEDLPLKVISEISDESEIPLSLGVLKNELYLEKVKKVLNKSETQLHLDRVNVKSSIQKANVIPDKFKVSLPISKNKEELQNAKKSSDEPEILVYLRKDEEELPQTKMNDMPDESEIPLALDNVNELALQEGSDKFEVPLSLNKIETEFILEKSQKIPVKSKISLSKGTKQFALEEANEIPDINQFSLLLGKGEKAKEISNDTKISLTSNKFIEESKTSILSDEVSKNINKSKEILEEPKISLVFDKVQKEISSEKANEKTGKFEVLSLSCIDEIAKEILDEIKDPLSPSKNEKIKQILNTFEIAISSGINVKEIPNESEILLASEKADKKKPAVYKIAQFSDEVEEKNHLKKTKRESEISLNSCNVEEKIPLQRSQESEISSPLGKVEVEFEISLPLDKIMKELPLEKSKIIPNGREISLTSGKVEEIYSEKSRAVPDKSESPLTSVEVEEEILFEKFEAVLASSNILVILGEIEEEISSDKYKEINNKSEVSLPLDKGNSELLLENVKIKPEKYEFLLTPCKVEKEIHFEKPEAVPDESQIFSTLSQVGEEILLEKPKKILNKSEISQSLHEVGKELSDESDISLLLIKDANKLPLDKFTVISSRDKEEISSEKHENISDKSKISPLYIIGAKKLLSERTENIPNEFEVLLPLVQKELHLEKVEEVLEEKTLNESANLLPLNEVQKELHLEKVDKMHDESGAFLDLNKVRKQLLLKKVNETSDTAEILLPMHTVEGKLSPNGDRDVCDDSEIHLENTKAVPDESKILLTSDEVEEDILLQTPKEIVNKSEMPLSLDKVEKELSDKPIFFLPWGTSECEVLFTKSDVFAGEVTEGIPSEESKRILNKSEILLNFDKIDKELADESKTSAPVVNELSLKNVKVTPHKYEFPLTPSKVEEEIYFEKSKAVSDQSEILLISDEEKIHLKKSNKILNESEVSLPLDEVDKNLPDKFLSSLEKSNVTPEKYKVSNKLSNESKISLIVKMLTELPLEKVMKTPDKYGIPLTPCKINEGMHFGKHGAVPDESEILPNSEEDEKKILLEKLNASEISLPLDKVCKKLSDEYEMSLPLVKAVGKLLLEKFTVTPSLEKREKIFDKTEVSPPYVKDTKQLPLEKTEGIRNESEILLPLNEVQKEIHLVEFEKMLDEQISKESEILLPLGEVQEELPSEKIEQMSIKFEMSSLLSKVPDKSEILLTSGEVIDKILSETTKKIVYKSEMSILLDKVEKEPSGESDFFLPLGNMKESLQKSKITPDDCKVPRMLDKFEEDIILQKTQAVPGNSEILVTSGEEKTKEIYKESGVLLPLEKVNNELPDDSKTSIPKVKVVREMPLEKVKVSPDKYEIPLTPYKVNEEIHFEKSKAVLVESEIFPIPGEVEEKILLENSKKILDESEISVAFDEADKELSDESESEVQKELYLEKVTKKSDEFDISLPFDKVRTELPLKKVKGITDEAKIILSTHIVEKKLSPKRDKDKAKKQIILEKSEKIHDKFDFPLVLGKDEKAKEILDNLQFQLFLGKDEKRKKNSNQSRKSLSLDKVEKELPLDLAKIIPPESEISLPLAKAKKHQHLEKAKEIPADSLKISTYSGKITNNLPLEKIKEILDEPEISLLLGNVQKEILEKANEEPSKFEGLLHLDKIEEKIHLEKSKIVFTESYVSLPLNKSKLPVESEYSLPFGKNDYDLHEEPAISLPLGKVIKELLLEKSKVTPGKIGIDHLPLEKAMAISEESKIQQPSNKVTEKISLEKTMMVCKESEVSPLLSKVAKKIPSEYIADIPAESGISLLPGKIVEKCPFEKDKDILGKSKIQFKPLPSDEIAKIVDEYDIQLTLSKNEEITCKSKNTKYLSEVLEDELPLVQNKKIPDDSDISLPKGKVEKETHLEKTNKIPKKSEISIALAQVQIQENVREIPDDSKVPLSLGIVEKELLVEEDKKIDGEFAILLPLGEIKKELIMDESKKISSGFENPLDLGLVENELSLEKIETKAILQSTVDVEPKAKTISRPTRFIDDLNSNSFSKKRYNVLQSDILMNDHHIEITVTDFASEKKNISSKKSNIIKPTSTGIKEIHKQNYNNSDLKKMHLKYLTNSRLHGYMQSTLSRDLKIDKNESIKLDKNIKPIKVDTKKTTSRYLKTNNSMPCASSDISNAKPSTKLYLKNKIGHTIRSDFESNIHLDKNLKSSLSKTYKITSTTKVKSKNECNQNKSTMQSSTKSSLLSSRKQRVFSPNASILKYNFNRNPNTKEVIVTESGFIKESKTLFIQKKYPLSENFELVRSQSAVPMNYDDSMKLLQNKQSIDKPLSLPASPNRFNNNVTKVMTSEVFTRTNDLNDSVEVIYKQPCETHKKNHIVKASELEISMIDTTDSSLSDSMALPSSLSDHDVSLDTSIKSKRANSPNSPKPTKRALELIYETKPQEAKSSLIHLHKISDNIVQINDTSYYELTKKEMTSIKKGCNKTCIKNDKKNTIMFKISDSLHQVEDRISPMLDVKAITPPRLKYKFQYENMIAAGCIENHAGNMRRLSSVPISSTCDYKP